jgi:hypothetical protein
MPPSDLRLLIGMTSCSVYNAPQEYIPAQRAHPVQTHALNAVPKHRIRWSRLAPNDVAECGDRRNPSLNVARPESLASSKLGELWKSSRIPVWWNKSRDHVFVNFEWLLSHGRGRLCDHVFDEMTHAHREDECQKLPVCTRTLRAGRLRVAGAANEQGLQSYSII